MKKKPKPENSLGIYPRGGRVLVERIPYERETMVGGLVIVQDKPPTMEGRVRAVGPLAKCSVGDVVIWRRGERGFDVRIAGVEYVLLSEVDDLLAVIDRSAA